MIEELQSTLGMAKKTYGRERLKKYLSSGQISRSEAMAAKCCECMAYYADGMTDCEVYTCPLYPWMPYRKD